MCIPRREPSGLTTTNGTSCSSRGKLERCADKLNPQLDISPRFHLIWKWGTRDCFQAHVFDNHADIEFCSDLSILRCLQTCTLSKHVKKADAEHISFIILLQVCGKSFWILLWSCWEVQACIWLCDLDFTETVRSKTADNLITGWGLSGLWAVFARHSVFPSVSFCSRRTLCFTSCHLLSLGKVNCTSNNERSFVSLICNEQQTAGVELHGLCVLVRTDTLFASCVRQKSSSSG